MAGVNQVILIGNVGADPEIRYMPNGDAVANLRLATTERWKDKQTGEQREATEWHRVVFFGAVAGVIENYVRKGSQLYVSGKLRTRKWQDSSGQDRWTTEIRGQDMQMLGGRPDQGAGYADSSQGQSTRPPAQQPSEPQQQNWQDQDFPDDDIPF